MSSCCGTSPALENPNNPHHRKPETHCSTRNLQQIIASLWSQHNGFFHGYIGPWFQSFSASVLKMAKNSCVLFLLKFVSMKRPAQFKQVQASHTHWVKILPFKIRAPQENHPALSHPHLRHSTPPDSIQTDDFLSYDHPRVEQSSPRSDHSTHPKLQALVYDILPSTTAVFSYAIGSRKLSANE